MSKWTHSICEDCWDKRNPASRAPRGSKGAPERCCFCGKKHSSGIYVREDPESVECRGVHRVSAFQVAHAELLTCVCCGYREQGTAEAEPTWPAIEIRGQRFRACPRCVPGPFLDSVDSVKRSFEHFVDAALLEMRAHV